MAFFCLRSRPRDENSINKSSNQHNVKQDEASQKYRRPGCIYSGIAVAVEGNCPGYSQNKAKNRHDKHSNC